MSNRKISTTTKALIDARKLIEKPENWCRFTLGKDAQGNGVTPYEPGNKWDTAVAFCAYGAVIKAVNYPTGEDVFKACSDRLASVIPPGVSIANYNNFGSHGEVLEMFGHAIASSIQEDNS